MPEVLLKNMQDYENNLKFRPAVLGYPFLFLSLIWLVFWVEIRFGLDFNHFGIIPQNFVGLRGIFFSPFIHANFKHLFNNSIPLFVLSSALFYFYKNISWNVLAYGFLLTGILTWIIGRPSFHIGASGIIYMLASFLFFKGIFSKYYRLIALSLTVVFLYGGLLWYLTPIDPQISWEGHLSGFVTGFLFSLIYKQKILKRPKYEWEKPEFDESNDPFMRQFDKDGNFVQYVKEEEEVEEELPHMFYRYSFKKAVDEDKED